MWTRKSSSEIAQQERKGRLTPIPALLAASFGAAIISFLDWGSYIGPAGVPHPTRSLQQVLPIFLGWAFFLFAFFYGSQLLSHRRFDLLGQDAKICERCLKVQGTSSSGLCHCGGILEPLRNWRWVRSDHPNT
jgi:hypothetical protein